MLIMASTKRWIR